MNALKIFLDISLLKAKPQDVPFSYQLLALTAVTSIVAYILALEPATPELARILGKQNSIIAMSIAEHGFFAATVWVILRLRGHQARFRRTILWREGERSMGRATLAWAVLLAGASALATEACGGDDSDGEGGANVTPAETIVLVPSAGTERSEADPK